MGEGLFYCGGKEKERKKNMKKVITLVAAIMLLVTSSLALAGCGGTKTLEEYVNSDSDVQQELSDLESKQYRTDLQI